MGLNESVRASARAFIAVDWPSLQFSFTLVTRSETVLSAESRLDMHAEAALSCVSCVV
jgi:hypothetical protein